MTKKEMTKKERILEEAISLFSEKGFFAVSTRQISKQAEVSEGLIFKHYESKEGLLKAIFQKGYDSLGKYAEKLETLTNSREKVHALIELPHNMIDENLCFWKLIFGLKLQHQDLYKKLRPYDVNDDITKQLNERLKDLGIKNKQLEIEKIMVYFEGVIQTKIKSPEKNLQKLIDYWKSQY